MSQKIQNYLSFRPAAYHTGKCCYVSFYVLDPLTEQLTRQRIKLDHVPRSERRRYAVALCNSINERLYGGWNPLVERVAKASVTVTEAMGRYIEAKTKATRKDTMRSYRSFAASFLEFLTKRGLSGKFLLSVDQALLQEYLTDLEDGISNRTYNNYVGFLRGFFEWCKLRRWIGDNPASQLPTKRVDEKKRAVIPPDVRSRILRYFEAENPNFIPVMMMCYRLFIRPKEICGLVVGNINFAEGLLTVPAEVAKNHKERVLALPDEILSYLVRYKDTPKDWYIFSTKRYVAEARKAPMKPTRIDDTWHNMRTALGLPDKYQFYSLKDTGITEMLEAGVPQKFVKELADHSSLAITEKYTHKAEAKKILEWNKIKF